MSEKFSYVPCSNLRNDAEQIWTRAIRAVLPDEAVRRALAGADFPGRVFLVAVGKAAWQMANAALQCLSRPVDGGIVITKEGHVRGELPTPVLCREGGHPVPDARSFRATEEALDLLARVRLTETDTVLLLLSGGGSALFEKPLVPPEVLLDVTRRLLACGADIGEMNTIRKRLSAVKGGRFAKLCEPARIFQIVLSDIVGDPLDLIASGPAAPDETTCEEALEIARRYRLELPDCAWERLREEPPKALSNVRTEITGSVRELCRAAFSVCAELGYEPILLTDCLTCQAREAGAFLASVVRTHAHDGKRLAFLAGGETVVRLTGSGKGGRNQELALAAAAGIDGLPNAAVFSVGSDGTDGPTDAAGGYVDGETTATLRKCGVDIRRVLEANDSYHALARCGGLIITGPTGTNVNDLSVALIHDV